MKNLYIFLSAILIATAFADCGQQSTRHKLEEIDSLICAQMPDSAFAELRKINVSSLSDDNKAYFYLLATQASYLAYKPIKSDSIICISVEYYKAAKDNDKLGESYYYKGMIEHLLGHSDSAIINLKDAESIAINLPDIKLKHKVYNGLASLNYATANYALAMEYARKELAISEKAGDISWIANACNHMACTHEKIGNKDSVYHYIKRLIPYIGSVTEDTKAYYLSNIGQYYLHYKDTLQAKKYLTMSYKTKPIAETINMLSKIYYSEGDTSTAFRLLYNASETADLDSKIKIYETLAYFYYIAEDYESSGRTTAILKNMKDSLLQIRRTYAIHELQLVYDNKKNSENIKKTRNLIGAGVVALMLIGAGGIWLYRCRRFSEKRYTQKIIDEYECKISKLEMSEDGLTKKLAELESNDSESLSYGYALYKNITEGGTTIEWKKSCFESFVRYYNVVDPAFIKELEKKYSGLSAVNKSLLIMQNMGFSNEQIRNAMCMSAGALRAARFRIKTKAIH